MSNSIDYRIFVLSHIKRRLITISHKEDLEEGSRDDDFFLLVLCIIKAMSLSSPFRYTVAACSRSRIVPSIEFDTARSISLVV